MIANEECKLVYPQLTDTDCNELFVIKRNYGHYNKNIRKIADARVQEIKFHLLSDDERIEKFLDIISNMQNDHIPVSIINNILQVRKQFVSLSPDVQKEIVSYALKGRKQSLSTTANDYLDNKSLFIMPIIMK